MAWERIHGFGIEGIGCESLITFLFSSLWRLGCLGPTVVVVYVCWSWTERVQIDYVLRFVQ